MKKIKYMCIIFAFTYLLSACSFTSKINASISQNINQKDNSIESLPNGNYRYCSDHNPYLEDELDVHRYCFTFTKTGNQVVGGYLYRSPKDTPYICIKGKVDNNLVTGTGYENIGPSTKPYTEEDFPSLNKLSDELPLSYWDDVEKYQGGLNLKVGNPSLYKLSPAIENGHRSYWAIQRYEIVELDLSDFEKIEVLRLPLYAECTS